MLKSKIVSIVSICSRYSRTVIAISVLLTALSGLYSAHNFSINTDVNKLISPDLPWRQRELAVDKAFPHRHELILAVVDAPTSELATQASKALVDRLTAQSELFKSVHNTAESPFFTRNALLFLPAQEVEQVTGQLIQ